MDTKGRLEAWTKNLKPVFGPVLANGDTTVWTDRLSGYSIEPLCALLLDSRQAFHVPYLCVLCVFVVISGFLSVAKGLAAKIAEKPFIMFEDDARSKKCNVGSRSEMSTSAGETDEALADCAV